MQGIICDQLRRVSPGGEPASYTFSAAGLTNCRGTMESFIGVPLSHEGSCIGVLADSECDIGLIGYEIAVLADRAGTLLTPGLITELREGLPQ